MSLIPQSMIEELAQKWLQRLQKEIQLGSQYRAGSQIPFPSSNDPQNSQSSLASAQKSAAQKFQRPSNSPHFPTVALQPPIPGGQRMYSDYELIDASPEKLEIMKKHRHRRQTLRARDGALVGYRCWKLSAEVVDGERGYYLRSPHRSTLWTGPTLVADNWTNDSAVRGVAGIHALYRRERSDLEQLLRFVWGRVRGYGDYVQGSDGWRAEIVVVDKLWLPSVICLSNGCVLIPQLALSYGISIPERLEDRYGCKVVVFHPGGPVLNPGDLICSCGDPMCPGDCFL